MLRHRHKKGQSIIEYATLIIIILAGLLLFQKYMMRGMAGRWRDSGDSFGYGRQYDPHKTKECSWAFQYGINAWYKTDLFYQKNCDVKCFSWMKGNSDPGGQCQQCIAACVADSSSCNISTDGN